MGVSLQTNIDGTNRKFYTLLYRKGMNNRRQIYTRVYVVYGEFIDSETYKYNIVYNNKLIDDLEKKYCGLKQFFLHDNDKIYMFNNIDDAIEQCKIINEDFKKIKLR